MNRLLLSLLGILMAGALSGVSAQVVTTSPALVQTDSKNIVVTFYADRGNKGLMDLPASDKVYAHTGVITSTSKDDSDWQFAPSWGDNSAKYLLTRVSENVYTLEIPDIDTYYGITNPDVVVKKLMFVFRNANKTKEGKTENGGDIAVEVYPAGFNVAFTSSLQGSVVTDSNPVTFTVSTSADANITITLGGESTPLASATQVTTLSAEYAFQTAGDYTVTAVAQPTAGGESVTRTLTVSRIEQAQAQDYPGGVPVMGAVRGDDGTVTFCIAAPGKSSMMIVGSWNGYQNTAAGAMNYQDYEGQRYFWTSVPDLASATDYFYYYLADGTVAVGDPYARLVLDPYNDQYISAEVFPGLPAYPSASVPYKVPLAVYNSAIDEYDWEVTDFKGVPQSQLVIYELLVRDFTGEEGMAAASGTINGVIEKLDYIKGLGVNAVELLPIMEFNGNNSWGYNTNFYFAPDKAYGTPSDYRRLIDECHKRGMAVILDIVFNQSDGLHPWYQLYDIANNPFYNGSAPHSYSVLNDWNQDNALVQKQWHDALAYWLTAYKCDGFRFDLVKGLGDNSSYDNTYYPATNTFGTPSEANTNKYNASRIARMKTLHDAMRLVNPDAYFINEDLAEAEEENALAKDGDANWANVNSQACQFAKGVQSNSSLNRFYAPMDGKRTWGSTVSYAESHDEERMAYVQKTSGSDYVKNSHQLAMRLLGSVGAQMLMTPGAHMIWQFQEFGADQTTKNSSGNDTSPKRVVWSYLDDPDRAGLKESYAALCALRAENPDLFSEETSTEVNLGISEWSTGRSIKLRNGSKEIICLVNCRPTTSISMTNPFTTQNAADYRLVASSYNAAPALYGNNVTLPAGAFAVYMTGSSSGIIDAAGSASVKVYATPQRRIVVEGACRSVSVFDITGRSFAIDSTFEPGIYVVKADGETHKVIVR